MTNYSERLDEILDTPTRYIHQYGCACTKLKRPKECDCEPFDALAEAKQAITSLIQELVAEAKPEVKAHPLGPVTLADCQRGLDHYEYGLLKALEEV